MKVASRERSNRDRIRVLCNQKYQDVINIGIILIHIGIILIHDLGALRKIETLGGKLHRIYNKAAHLLFRLGSS